MPLFVVSVELVDIALTHPNYGDLHHQMDVAGFKRSIVFGGHQIDFVHAQYGIIDENATAVEICQRAKAIAGNVDYRNRVNVCAIRALTDFAYVPPVRREHPVT